MIFDIGEKRWGCGARVFKMEDEAGASERIFDIGRKKVTIEHFTDLNVWKEAHALTIDMYAVSKEFPADERFGLTSQIRRASSSIGANIAEGFRRYHYGDRVIFYYQARASLSEVQNFITR